MLFSVVAHLKPGAAAKISETASAFSAHLEQPFMRIRLAGPLRNEQGELTGFMGLIEAKSFAEVDGFLKRSPCADVGLYEHVDVAELEPQVGRL